MEKKYFNETLSEKLAKFFTFGKWKRKYQEECNDRVSSLPNETFLAKKIYKAKIRRQKVFRWFGLIPYTSLYTILIFASTNQWFGTALEPLNKFHNAMDYHFGSTGKYIVEPLITWIGCKITNNWATRKLYVGYVFREIYRVPTYLITMPYWIMENKNIKKLVSEWELKKVVEKDTK